MIEEDMPSLRVLGKFTALWAMDYKVGLTDSFGKESSQVWPEPGHTINRNKLQIRGNFPYDGQERSWDVTVVYYNADTKKVQAENGTTTERFANVTGVDQQTVSFSPGFQSTANISLRAHYDDSKKVAIYLQDEDDGEAVAKWGPYNHKSVETTAGLPFATWGGFLPWQIWWFILPVGFGGAIAVGGGMAFAKRTGGFGKGLMWWALVAAIAGGAVLFIYYAEIVQFVVFIPTILALPVVFGLFVVTVEKVKPGATARLEQPSIQETESAIGDSRPSIEHERADIAHVFDRDEGLAFINYGSIKAALARLFASAEDESDAHTQDGLALIPQDAIQKRYEIGGTSPDTRKFYIKDYDFTPAHWSYSFPDLKTYEETEEGGYVAQWRTGFIAGSVVAILVGASLASSFFGGPALGIALAGAGILATGMSAEPGEIDVEFADAADISAKAARITETQERMKYDALDKAIEGIVAAQEDVGKEILKITQKTQQEQDSVIDTLHAMADSGQLAKDLSDNGDGSDEVSSNAD